MNKIATSKPTDLVANIADVVIAHEDRINQLVNAVATQAQVIADQAQYIAELAAALADMAEPPLPDLPKWRKDLFN